MELCVHVWGALLENSGLALVVNHLFFCIIYEFKIEYYSLWGKDTTILLLYCFYCKIFIVVSETKWISDWSIKTKSGQWKLQAIEH